MVSWADTQGHFLFAPDALVDAQPYIDRLEILVRIPTPLITRSSIPTFLDSLRGDVFCSREGYLSKIRASWLFRGYVRLYPGTADGASTVLELKLILNSTRFLQANAVPNSIDTREQMFNFPRRFLRKQPGSAIFNRLERTRSVTFDNNDNFLHSSQINISPIADWAERTTEYAELVYQVVRTELLRAAGHTIAAGAHAQMFPDFDNLAMQVSQVEFYWEFRVANAIRKVADTQHLFAGVLLSSFRSEYPIPGGPELGHDRNSNLVRGKLGHQDISAKLYAKSSYIVRFELSFTSDPWRTVSADRRRRSSVVDQGRVRLIQLLHTLADEAQDRSDRLWSSFWSLVPRNVSGDQFGIKRLFNMLSLSTADSGVSPSEVMEILLTIGSIAPFSTGSNNADPVRRLVDWGVLTRLESSSTRSPRYRISRRYAPVLEELRRLPEHAPRVRASSRPLAHEDTLAVRIRPRQIMRLDQ